MPSIHIPRPWQIPEKLATPEDVFLNRRQVLRALGFGALAAGLPLPLACATPEMEAQAARKLAPALGTRHAGRFPATRNAAFGLGNLKLTPEDTAATYNNFYEFTTDKDRVWKLAAGYPVDPWKIEVTGLVKKKRTLDLDDVMTRFPLEERLYRFRCVERWAMQVPWKYGYKGPKSIVRIEFMKDQPKTFWNDLQPAEYGFYSNINPEKPHPRWSQAMEEDIGTGEHRQTLLYNGYGDLVGSMYNGREV